MIEIKCDICGKSVKSDSVFACFEFKPTLPANMRCKTDFEFCKECSAKLSRSIEKKQLFERVKTNEVKGNEN